MSNKCQHQQFTEVLSTDAQGCEECLQMGDKWVHLRICLECGHVGCCDSSKNKHASAHYRKTKHPVIQSFEANEIWGWCYADNMMLSFSEKKYQQNL